MKMICMEFLFPSWTLTKIDGKLSDPIARTLHMISSCFIPESNPIWVSDTLLNQNTKGFRYKVETASVVAVEVEEFEFIDPLSLKKRSIYYIQKSYQHSINSLLKEIQDVFLGFCLADNQKL